MPLLVFLLLISIFLVSACMAIGWEAELCQVSKFKIIHVFEVFDSTLKVK